jgi:hypothetical protein
VADGWGAPLTPVIGISIYTFILVDYKQPEGQDIFKDAQTDKKVPSKTQAGSLRLTSS